MLNVRVVPAACHQVRWFMASSVLLNLDEEHLTQMMLQHRNSVRFRSGVDILFDPVLGQEDTISVSHVIHQHLDWKTCCTIASAKDACERAGECIAVIRNDIPERVDTGILGIKVLVLLSKSVHLDQNIEIVIHVVFAAVLPDWLTVKEA